MFAKFTMHYVLSNIVITRGSRWRCFDISRIASITSRRTSNRSQSRNASQRIATALYIFRDSCYLKVNLAREELSGVFYKVFVV